MKPDGVTLRPCIINRAEDFCFAFNFVVLVGKHNYFSEKDRRGVNKSERLSELMRYMLL